MEKWSTNRFDLGFETTKLDFVKSKLEKELPQYIVNCFLAAGYDSFEVIAEMNASNKPGNSIDCIEEFINEQHPGENEYTHMNSKKCIFPPGHRNRIAQFIKMTQKYALKNADFELPCGIKNRKRKHNTDNTAKKQSNPLEIYRTLRTSISKWQRTQTSRPEIKNLQENKDFTIKIEADDDNGECKSAITCKCGSTILLPSVNEKATISNWTRHILKNCRGSVEGKTGKQTSMTSFIHVTASEKEMGDIVHVCHSSPVKPHPQQPTYSAPQSTPCKQDFPQAPFNAKLPIN